MKHCRTCGLALDGRMRRAHIVTVNLDGQLSAGGLYCLEHYEQARGLLLAALVTVDEQAHSLRVAAGGGAA